MDKWFEDLQAELGVEKVDKCGLCLLQVSLGYYGKARIDEPFCVVGIEPQDCHLTPDHQRIVNAMIRGVFDCGHCGKKTGYRPDDYVLCTHGLDPQYVKLDRFCPAWHERKEGEDG